LVQVSYAIGVARPISVFVTGYGTSKYSDDQLTQIVNHNFDLRPGVIVRELDLKKPIYQATSSYGHFGRPEFTWEQPKAIKMPSGL
jgi:S-adenosylmethionine synthetase